MGSRAKGVRGSGRVEFPLSLPSPEQNDQDLTCPNHPAGTTEPRTPMHLGALGPVTIPTCNTGSFLLLLFLLELHP